MGEVSQIKETECYAALDLEMTGLDAKNDRIIEIGAIRVEKGIVTGTFSSLVRPGRKLEAQVEELTNITDRMLEGAPEIPEVMERLSSFTEGLPLLGHNIAFDYRFLKQAAVDQGMRFERDGIDTLTLCRLFMPPDEKKNLGSACSYYGVRPQTAHRALSDAFSAHFLYQALLNRHFQEKPEAFMAKPLNYHVKRRQPATKKQKEVLRDLLKYHKINLSAQIDGLTRNEVSRMIDKIVSQCGRAAER